MTCLRCSKISMKCQTFFDLQVEVDSSITEGLRKTTSFPLDAATASRSALEFVLMLPHTQAFVVSHLLMASSVKSNSSMQCPFDNDKFVGIGCRIDDDMSFKPVSKHDSPVSVSKRGRAVFLVDNISAKYGTIPNRCRFADLFVAGILSLPQEGSSEFARNVTLPCARSAQLMNELTWHHGKGCSYGTAQECG